MAGKNYEVVRGTIPNAISQGKNKPKRDAVPGDILPLQAKEAERLIKLGVVAEPGRRPAEAAADAGSDPVERSQEIEAGVKAQGEAGLAEPDLAALKLSFQPSFVECNGYLALFEAHQVNRRREISEALAPWVKANPEEEKPPTGKDLGLSFDPTEEELKQAAAEIEEAASADGELAV